MHAKKPKTIKNMNIVWEIFIEDMQKNCDDLDEISCKELLELNAKDMEEWLVRYEWDYKVEPSIEGFNKVWQSLMQEAETGIEARKKVSKFFNKYLDDLLAKDYFGTEGQCDPRGDHRQ